jgi:hypothetical protein
VGLWVPGEGEGDGDGDGKGDGKGKGKGEGKGEGDCSWVCIVANQTDYFSGRNPMA